MAKKTEVAVITDIGEKIGGARKDVAVKVGPRPQRTDPADTRPGWAKRFVPAESIGYDKKPTGKWQILDTRRESKWGGYRAASRMEFESQAAAERAIPLIAVSQKHYVRENYAKGADGKSATAAKMVAFANHVGRAANKLGAIAMIAAPVTAAALAYDATRNQAAADGLSPTQQTTQALGSAAAAGIATAGIGYGIMKGLVTLAKASPKIIGRALPGVGLGLMAYGAYQGGKRHGWKGVVLGSVGADGLLDLGAGQAPQVNESLPAPASPSTAKNFEVANDAFNAMQETAAAEQILRGFQNPTNLAAALAAQGKELGRHHP